MFSDTFQTYVQVLQLAYITSWSDWLYGDVFPDQPAVFLHRDYHHVVADYSSTLPVIPDPVGSDQSGLNLPSGPKISLDVGYT